MGLNLGGGYPGYQQPYNGGYGWPPQQQTGPDVATILQVVKSVVGVNKGPDLETARAYEQERFEMRMKELREEERIRREAEERRQERIAEERRREARSEQEREATRQQQQNAMWQNMLEGQRQAALQQANSQAQQNASLLTAVMAKDKDGGSPVLAYAKMAGDMFKNMSESQMALVQAATAIASGEDSRTTFERFLDVAFNSDVAKTLATRLAGGSLGQHAMGSAGEEEGDAEVPQYVTLADQRQIPTRAAEAVVQMFQLANGRDPDEATMLELFSRWADRNPQHVVLPPTRQLPPVAEVPQPVPTPQPAPPAPPAPAPVGKVPPEKSAAAVHVRPKLPTLPQAPWAAKSAVVHLQQAFQRGQDPVEALRDLESRDLLSRAAVHEIGAVTVHAVDTAKEEGKAATLVDVLGKVFPLLEEHGVRIPGDFLPVFQDPAAPVNGAEWLDRFLSLCGDTWTAHKEQRARDVKEVAR